MVGATLGVAAVGMIISVYGVGVAVASGYIYTAIPLMGGTAIQTFARGALLYNVIPIFIAPFIGIEVEVIKISP